MSQAPHALFSSRPSTRLPRPLTTVSSEAPTVPFHNSINVSRDPYQSISASVRANQDVTNVSNVTQRDSLPPTTIGAPSSTGSHPSTSAYAVIPTEKKKTKKKYKPVALKVRPVIGELPERYRIVRNIIGDPLASLPTLDPRPVVFKPTGRYTQERMELFNKINSGFLLDEERKLLHHFMMIHQDAFAWNDTERGHFREDFFPPIEIPVVPHKPWVQKNIPIPPGIYEEVCEALQRKIDAGVLEPSNSSYRSRWFCVVKKDGKSLRIVQSLEPLNEVTIQHSGVPPFSEQLVEHFAARACGSMMDLYVGYDERALAKSSRDYTTFQTPFGAMRLTTLPMGWTNSVPIFHDDVTYILRPEIPLVTQPYIDDVPVRGPATRYVLPSGEEERIKENPGIRRFVWEHFQDLNRICQRMKYCGGTFSGFKSFLCAPEISVLGQRCTINGRLPDEGRVIKVKNWAPCPDLSDVRAFVGTIGVCRMFIRNFASRAHHLVKLTRKGAEWEFGEYQLAAMEDLKEALINSPALRPINYTTGASVILSVDTSYIAVGFLLSQCDVENPKLRYYAKFGSITLNEREARFSQPKLELYGLYRTLRSLKIILLGVRNLVVEVDAAYIKGMLRNPDLAPSASINRWIVSILMFHFTLVHVPGTHHGPDGLSRRRPQPGDEDEPEDDFEDWIDQVHGFMHFVNPTPSRAMLSHGTVTSPPISCYIIEVSEDSPTTNDEPAERAELSLTYADVPRSEKARAADAKLGTVKTWHQTLEWPPDIAELTSSEYKSFMRYCTEFFVSDGERLWRKDNKGNHKVVVAEERRLFLMASAHDDVGHHGFYATNALLTERYWWPQMAHDISWFIRSCHLCQLRKTQHVLIPPTVDMPAPLFSKVYMDTMHLTPSAGYKYIVQGRCSLTHWPEWEMLRTETAKTLAHFILNNIIYRWGTLLEIVTDNGGPFVKAMDYLGKKFHIKHIRISGYNSRANGIVERSHFDVRQALFKACDGDQSKWSSSAYSVFWAERVTVRRRMGCSPYFATTGTHPLLPFDIAEANYLLPPPDAVLSTTDLIVRRAIALQKRRPQLAELNARVYEARRQAAFIFEKEHAHSIRTYDFKLGDLVLIRNTAIEKALNRKMRARYLGPCIVVSKNKGGAYIIAELDGSVFDRPIAAFRVIPYLARNTIALPPLDTLIDISASRLTQMERDTTADPEEDENEAHLVDPAFLDDDD
jgi:Integrase zinc binding domain/RNase H-like domain found in reverse transcriptase